MRRVVRKQAHIVCTRLSSAGIEEAGADYVARDISLEGLRLDKPAAFGQREVSLALSLPGEAEPICVSASVVHETVKGVGMRFTRISHRDFVRLRGWLRDCAIRDELLEFRAA